MEADGEKEEIIAGLLNYVVFVKLEGKGD